MPYVLVDELSGSNQLEKGHELLPQLVSGYQGAKD
jgi:hypothetical protein